MTEGILNTTAVCTPFERDRSGYSKQCVCAATARSQINHTNQSRLTASCHVGLDPTVGLHRRPLVSFANPCHGLTALPTHAARSPHAENCLARQCCLLAPIQNIRPNMLISKCECSPTVCADHKCTNPWLHNTHQSARSSGRRTGSNSDTEQGHTHQHTSHGRQAVGAAIPARALLQHVEELCALPRHHPIPSLPSRCSRRGRRRAARVAANDAAHVGG